MIDGCIHGRWTRRTLLRIVVWLVACIGPGLCLANEPPPRSILVLDPANVRGPFYYEIFSSLRSAVNASTPPVTIYNESLDLSRFRGAEYEESLEAHLRVKYRDKPVGVVIAIGSATLDYVLRRHAVLWPGTPVVFGMVDEPTVARLKPAADVTGSIMKLRFEDMMVTARAVVPDLAGVALVGDPLDSQVVWQHFVDEIPPAVADIEFIDLTGIPLRELRERVAALPDRTAILYTGIYSDGEGTYFPPADAVALLAEVANRPIVVTAETFVGRGTVGGFVMTPAAIGQQAARLALRILDGEPASGMPVTMADVVKPIFDWRQLQRWQVDEDNLPPNSEVRFRNPTVWQQYRWPILAIGYALLAQAALIAWLLYERHHRLRSEAEAHDLSGRLINAGEEERARLARELHDDVTQRLALLAIAAGREERSSLNSDAGPMRTMREGLVRLSEDVHALSYRLHPSILSDLGLIEALKAECERFSRTCPTRFDANPRDIPEHLPPDVALCLFRIAQEGLRNIARHAKATAAEVTLRYRNGGFELSVRDDGIGFDASRNHARVSLGHASMRQRTLALGGKVEINSTPGTGTVIRAWVPVREERREPSARAAG